MKMLLKRGQLNIFFFFFFFFFCESNNAFGLLTMFRLHQLQVLLPAVNGRKQFMSLKENTGCQVPHFMILLIPYIELLNLSWIIKCKLFRNIELNSLKEKL